MALEYIIYADESTRKGEYFSNFYGGILVRSVDLEPAQIAIRQKAQSVNLTGEIKWTKVTAHYLEKYVAVMDIFFDFVQADKIKYRLMFTQNRFVPQGLTREQRENEYFLLYYQFIKHAFGLQYANPTGTNLNRHYID